MGDVFRKSKKVYDPRQFWGLWLLITIAALCTVKKLESGSKFMPREQTDEWKGWMQMMFLMYHYFAEKEVYNAIRVYIAAYVWMTGFGNTALFTRKDQFSLRRLCHTLFRLNFLGFVICVLLNNEYMLYYICAMHTLFTLFVMGALFVYQDLNSSKRLVYAKIAVLGVITVIIYDGPEVIFNGIFGTLPVIRPLMAFHDPLHPKFTEMHEWHFRSGLDRFIWLFGMAFALHLKNFQSWCETLDALPLARRSAIISGILFVVAVIATAWWYLFFSREKFSYNHIHPFTSFVPIFSYLCLRNLVPALRQRYLFLFSFMGKYTLETYIFQFHIWMRTTGINGSPKHLLEWVPGYYWVNFAIITAVYIFLSIRFFNLTVTLSETLIRKDPRGLAISGACLVTCAVISWMLAGFVTMGR